MLFYRKSALSGISDSTFNDSTFSSLVPTFVYPGFLGWLQLVGVLQFGPSSHQFPVWLECLFLCGASSVVVFQLL